MTPRASRSSSVVEGESERGGICESKNLADFSLPFVIYEIPREKSDKIRCGP